MERCLKGVVCGAPSSLIFWPRRRISLQRTKSINEDLILSKSMSYSLHFLQRDETHHFVFPGSSRSGFLGPRIKKLTKWPERITWQCTILRMECHPKLSVSHHHDRHRYCTLFCHSTLILRTSRCVQSVCLWDPRVFSARLVISIIPSLFPHHFLPCEPEMKDLYMRVLHHEMIYILSVMCER